jgi:hypothetical protein
MSTGKTKPDRAFEERVADLSIRYRTPNRGARCGAKTDTRGVARGPPQGQEWRLRSRAISELLPSPRS